MPWSSKIRSNGGTPSNWSRGESRRPYSVRSTASAIASGSADQDRHPHHRGQVRDVDVVGILGEEPVAAGDQLGDRVAPAGGSNWPRPAMSARRLAESSPCRWRISRSAQAIRTGLVVAGKPSNAEIAEQVP